MSNGYGQSYVVNNIDLLEGFTFGEAAKEIETTGYNIWTVTNTNDGVFPTPDNSLRWAIKQVNQHPGEDNYIHFDIPGSGPHVISLYQDLPQIEGKVVIDGNLMDDNTPRVIIDGGGTCAYPLFVRFYETDEYFHLQKMAFVNFQNEIYIDDIHNIKLLSNMMYNTIAFEYNNPVRQDLFHIQEPHGTVEIKGNFLGTGIDDIGVSQFNNHYNVGILFDNYNNYGGSGDYILTIGGDDIKDRNIITAGKMGIWMYYSDAANSIINNNLIFNEEGHGGINMQNSITTLSQNLFYQCNDAINLNQSNTNIQAPTITSNYFLGSEIYIEGTTYNNRQGELIEVFLSTSGNPEDVIKYLGSVISDDNGRWILSSISVDWDDPLFVPQGGDVLLATSTFSGETSDFSDTVHVTCESVNLSITNPPAACYVDLTHPSIITGSTGGQDVLINPDGLITEDHTNSTDHFTDMSWWGDHDHPQSIVDGDESTYFKARPRSFNDNYVIIDMQKLRYISRMEIFSGENVFSDGVCEIYMADWEGNPGTYRITDLNWSKVNEFGPLTPHTKKRLELGGVTGRFIKLQLTTSTDKDIWDIKEIRLYTPLFSYYEDEGAAIPLVNPGRIKSSGTYYIKMGNEICFDIKPVQVNIDPLLCPGCPTDINITDPDPACTVNLTDPFITAGSKGGTEALIDKAGFITEDPTNSGETYTDIGWRADEGGPQAVVDTISTTYFHAQPRSFKTNYLIINMQKIYELSRVEIESGNHVFNEGVCEVYVADWEDHTGPNKIDSLNWKYVGEFGPPSLNSIKTFHMNGDSAQFIKIQLTTGIDKDYWDIRSVRAFKYTYTYWQDDEGSISLTDPENITTSGTYYIKTGEGICSAIEPVHVTIDPSDCSPYCNMVIHDPPPGCSVDLTDPSIIAESNAGEHGLIDKSGFVTNNDFSNMTWWNDADGPEGCIDQNPNTYFHAQARTFNDINYMIIDMQSEYSLGKIKINSGYNVFDEGTCKVYLSDDNTNWEKVAEFDPIFYNSTKAVYLYGKKGRYVKLHLDTKVDKDYWDIHEIDFYSGDYTYWEDADATIPLDDPENIRESGTYYIKMQAGTCTNIKPVNVNIDYSLCPDPGTYTIIYDSVITQGASSNICVVGDFESVSWDPHEDISCSACECISVSPENTTTYGLYISTNGHIIYRNVTINVIPLPQITFATGHYDLCKGEDVQLTPDISGTYDSVKWFPSQGLSDPKIINPVASPSVSTTYTLHIYINDAVVSGDILVNVMQPPVLVSDKNHYICSGEEVNLELSGTIDYVDWVAEPKQPVTRYGHNATYRPQETSIYYVTATNGPCSLKEIINVTVYPAPSALFWVEQNGNTITAHQTGPDNHAYSWDFGDGSTTTGRDPSHTYTPGTYTICLTQTGDCGEQTQTQTLCKEIEISSTSYFNCCD